LQRSTSADEPALASKVASAHASIRLEESDPQITRASANLLGAEIAPVVDERKKITGVAVGASRFDDSRTLFVSNLGSAISEKELHDHFAPQCEGLHETRLVLDPNGIPRGFAYLEFKTSECMTAALKMKNSKLCGRKLSVRVSNPKIKEKPASSASRGTLDSAGDSSKVLGTANRKARVSLMVPSTVQAIVRKDSDALHPTPGNSGQGASHDNLVNVKRDNIAEFGDANPSSFRSQDDFRAMFRKKRQKEAMISPSDSVGETGGT